MAGLAGLIVRTVLFVAIFIIATYYRNITPDMKPIIENALIRLKIKAKP
ncbi:MAG: hypothetical protein WDM90_23730 [Ferruginibacter sp.]